MHLLVWRWDVFAFEASLHQYLPVYVTYNKHKLLQTCFISTTVLSRHLNIYNSNVNEQPLCSYSNKWLPVYDLYSSCRCTPCLSQCVARLLWNMTHHWSFWTILQCTDVVTCFDMITFTHHLLLFRYMVWMAYSMRKLKPHNYQHKNLPFQSWCILNVNSGLIFHLYPPFLMLAYVCELVENREECEYFIIICENSAHAAIPCNSVFND